MYAVLPTLIDVIIVKHKRNKTIKKIKASLNEKGYIVPGLGDAGDRLFGTK